MPRPAVSRLASTPFSSQDLAVSLRTESETMGFWNAPGPNGSWRVVATWRHGQNPGPDSERSTVLTWDNATAQSLARRMLGMEPDGSLPWIFCAAHCARALCFEAAHWAADHFELASFAEAVSGHREAESAGASHTTRLLVFNEDQLVHLAAGFEHVAATTGGHAQHSHPDLTLAARACAAQPPSIHPFDPRSAAGFDPIEARVNVLDLFGLELDTERLLHFDIRSAALALGSGAAAAFARPARDAWSHPFLDVMSAKRSARAHLPEALLLGAHVELRDGLDAQRAVLLLTELRQAVILKAELDEHTPRPALRKYRSL